MALFDGLINEIEMAFGERVTAISKVYLLKRYFYGVGIVIGLILGITAHNLVVLLFTAAGASAACYFYAENYLLKVDREFFSVPGCSRREIFNK